MMFGVRQRIIRGLFRNAYCTAHHPPHLLDELKRLFKLVHPDLFHQFPHQKETNQRSFQLLQEYLNIAKGNHQNSTVPVYNFEFYIQHQQQQNNDELFMKKVELSLPAPQKTYYGAEMLPSTRSALSRLLSAFGLSADFSGSLVGGEMCGGRVKLSEFFQQASELQRQNESTVLGIEQRMIIVRNALRVGRGVTPSFRKALSDDKQLETLYNLARALDNAPKVELRGSTVMIGDDCGVDGFGNLWINHEDSTELWSAFFRQLDVNTLNTRRIAHKERRLKEFRAARLMEVEMIFTEDSISLKEEYTVFLDRLAEDADARGAVGDGKFHDLPVRVMESGELSFHEKMGYINVPLSQNIEDIYRYIARFGSDAMKRRMAFKAEEERMVNLNSHVRKKLRLRNLKFDEKLDTEQVRSACMRLLTHATKLRVFTEGLSICISDEYRLPVEGTRSLMHLKWNFTMAEL